LFKYASRYSWLIVLLTASSPIYDGSLDGDGISGAAFDGYSSRRNGDKGYWNSFVPELDYSGIESYTASVRRYIESGELFSAGELYLPVRVKSSGENSLESLEEKGIDHIELRMFDINPLEPYGISESDLRFVHYFLLYLFSLPDFEFTADLQRMAIENHKAAARFELDGIRIGGYSAAEAAHGLLDDMEIFFEGFPKVLEEIARQRAKLSGGNRACETVYGEYSEYSENFHEMFLEKIKEGRGVRVCANCSERA
jgi:glutamate--cysteine ligase